ncbi:SAM-dependent methyltransferase [Actinomadura sp. KC345]|nr:SAM-dependent methyltransferase [Actinomadura sp. KC345]
MDPEPVDLQTGRAHGARIYDYILGGKDHYAADRAAGNETLRVWPALRVHMQANRAFMHRVARYMAIDKGIRQFLDIGTGIPTSPNFHEVVQEIAPESRVVYVDNDPIVLVHARALMNSAAEGRTAYVQADMREPERIFSAPELLSTLDLTQPVGLTVIAVVHFIEDDDEAHRVVRELVDGLSAGSWVGIAIATDDFDRDVLAQVQQTYHAHGEALRWRSHRQALRFFDGLELEEPGVVQIHKWRPELGLSRPVDDKDIAMYGGVAVKR